MTFGPAGAPGQRPLPVPGPPDLSAHRQRIGMEIAQRQAGIARAETDIGQAVVDALSAPGAPAPPAHLQEELGRIQAARGYIDQLGQQLQAIDAQFAAAQAHRPDPASSCPACRSATVPGQRFCTVCGEKLVDREVASPAPGGVAPGTLPSCAQCGRPVEPGLTFCPLCGWRVGRSGVKWYRARWLRILLGGLALYFFTRIMLPHLGYPIAAIIADLIIGAAIVPVSFVAWLYERGTRDQTPPSALSLAFLLGGVVGTMIVFVVSQPIHIKGNWQFVPVGFIEEGAKLAIVLLFLRRKDLGGADRGLVIGAAVGMGFAALETMQYGLTAFLQVFISVLRQGGGAGDAFHYGVKFLNQNLQLRGLLAPMGHGTWTAIIAGVIWFTRARGKKWYSAPLWIAYVAMALLHALYDISIGAKVGQISLLGSKVGIFGIILGLAGFATLLAIVMLARRGRDPVSQFFDAATRLTKGAVADSGRPGYGLPPWPGAPGGGPGWAPPGPPAGWQPGPPATSPGWSAAPPGPVGAAAGVPPGMPLPAPGPVPPGYSGMPR